MKRIAYRVLAGFGLLLGPAPVMAQRLPVNVDAVTGTAVVSIPIEQVTNGGVSVPISIVYGSNGARLRDGEGTAGLGWNLVAGGQISRTVRGLPDDVKMYMPGETKLGWLYNTGKSAISSFSVANVTNPVNCTNAQTDLNYISSYFSYAGDTEPDIFNVSAPGLSCQFVFDGSNVIRTIPYQDVTIVPTYNPYADDIVSFTVTNDKGVKYVFSGDRNATRRTSLQPGPGSVYWSESNIKYYKTMFSQYKGGIQYCSSWMLASITDANGNKVDFGYTDMGETHDRKQVEFYVGTAARQPFYVINETDQAWALTTISKPGHTVTLTYGSYTNNVSEGTLINSITTRGVKYLFNYANVIFNKDQASFRNSCLRSVTTDQCDGPFNYFFEYEGESGSAGSSQFTDRDSAYKFTDVWGYYTGGKSNTIASVNTANVNAGTLKKIKYYDDGTTTLEYESNNYYDPSLSAVVNGGGVRIKTITDYDGISTGNNIVRNYTYLNPTTGVSSGLPVTLPQTSFLRPLPPTATLTNSTVTSDNDLSDDDHAIMYSFVKESQTGKGSTLYEYANPAMAFDNSVPLADWTPTLSSVGVPGCTTSLGFLQNTVRTYPFAPNANYDFERGLPKKETSYNDSGSKVAETTYTYQRSSAPVSISALRFDDDDYAKVYSKYSIYTTTSELTTRVDKIVFDPSSSTTGFHTTTNLTYGSSNHKLPTQTEITNSDGAVTRTNINYSKDYTTTTGNSNITALVAKNINAPIETYTATKPAGSSTFKVTGAQLTLYSQFPASAPSTYNVLPATIKSFASPSGISGFSPTTTSGIGTPDAHYATTSQLTDYSKYGILKSAVGSNKRPQTIISQFGTNLPLAVFANAALNQVAYGFDVSGGSLNPDGFVFTGTGTPTSTIGRSGLVTGLTYSGGISLTKTLSKPAEANNYTFSIWIKSASAGSFNVTATQSSTTQTVALSYQGSTDWKYYRISLPMTSFAAGAFTLSFSVPAGVSIDGDVMAYPQHASAASNWFNASFDKVVETNDSGLSSYYDRDNLGRVTFVYDQNKNIVSKNTYKYNAASVIPEAIFYIDVPVGQDNIYEDISYSFHAYNSFATCLLQGATYTWNYGDGSGNTTSSSHTFASPGTYNVTLTVSIPGVGTKNSTIPFVVLATPPPPVYLFYINNTSENGLDRIEFLQGGIPKYIVDADDLVGSSIPAGTYTVKVYYNSSDNQISLSTEVDSSTTVCKNWSHTSVYTYTSVTAANTFDLIINPTPCP